MFLTLFVALGVVWLLGFLAFHIAGGFDSPTLDRGADFLGGTPLRAVRDRAWTGTAASGSIDG